jgi:hypothetical protein
VTKKGRFEVFYYISIHCSSSVKERERERGKGKGGREVRDSLDRGEEKGERERLERWRGS